MPRDASGNYTLPSSVNPVVAGTNITVTWGNTTLGDVAQGVTDSLDRFGRGGMQGPFKSADGAVGAPGLTFNNEATTGIFRPAAGQIAFAAAGATIGLFTATGLTAPAFAPDGAAVPAAGMFRPGANTLGFSTNTIERLRIDGSGFIGINRAANTAIVDIQSDANAVVRVRGGTAINEGAAFFGASGSDTTRFAIGQISRIAGGTPGNDAMFGAPGYLSFMTGGLGTAQERMRILAAGGTVFNGIAPFIALAYNQSGGTPSYWELAAAGHATLVNAGTGSNGSWRFNVGNGGLEAMRIDSSGNVVINAAVAGAQFHVRGGSVTSIFDTATGDGRIELRNNGTRAGFIYWDAAENRFLADNGRVMTFYTSGGERARFNTSGNLGVGTTNPSAPFHVGLSGGSIQFRLGDETGANYWGIGRDNASTGALIFQSQATEVVRFLSDGNVGIGAAGNPFGGRLTVQRASTASVDIYSVDGTQAAVRFYNANNNSAIGNGAGGDLVFYANSAVTERMRLSNTGVLQIGTGVSTGSLRVLGLDESIRLAANNAFIAFHNQANTTRSGYIQFPTAAISTIAVEVNQSLAFLTNNLERMRITNAGVIQDAAGRELGYRNIPRVTSALERGCMLAWSGALTVNTANAGDTFTVYNDSASAFTITQGGGLTMRLAGTTSTGNRTLAPRGMATIWHNSTTECVISGPGVS